MADVPLQDANGEEKDKNKPYKGAGSFKTIECRQHEKQTKYTNRTHDGVPRGVAEGKNKKGGQETHHEPAKCYMAVVNKLDYGVEQPCPKQQQDDEDGLHQALGCTNRGQQGVHSVVVFFF